MKAGAAVLAAALWGAVAAPASAQEPPPPDYFTGIYERVGRDGGTPPGLMNDMVRIVAVSGGLEVSACNAGMRSTPIVLRHDRFGDVGNLLSTGTDEAWVGCQYFNDMDNYPILNGHDGKGALFTLWPAPDQPCAG